MIIIHLAPLLNCTGIEYPFPDSIENKLTLVTISFVQLKNLYTNKIILYTDSLGNDLIIKKLNLPYDYVEVHTQVSNHNKNFFCSFISFLSKLNDSFIVIDRNIILYEKLIPDSNKNFSCLTESIDISFYDALFKVNSKIKYNLIPPPGKVYDLSVWGATSSFVKSFFKYAKSFEEKIHLVEKKSILIDKFFYHFLLNYYIEQNKISVDMLKNDFLSDAKIKAYILFEDYSKNYGLIQINEDRKDDQTLYLQMAFQLKINAPDYFSNIKVNTFVDKNTHSDINTYLSSNTNLFEKKFCRTLAGIKNLKNFKESYLIHNEHELLTFINNLELSNDKESDDVLLLQDVYKFELAKSDYIKNIQSGKISLREDFEYYNEINEFLNHSDDYVSESVLSISDRVFLSYNSWKWNTHFPKEVDVHLLAKYKVIYNSVEKPAMYATSFVLNNIYDEVEEFSLEPLAIILLHYISENIKLNQAITLASNIYKSANFSQFKEISMYQIRELLLKGILVVN